MALSFPGRIRDNVSTVQRIEAKRGQEGDPVTVICHTMRPLHANYLREIIIYCIPKQNFKPNLIFSSLLYLYSPSKKQIKIKYLNTIKENE